VDTKTDKDTSADTNASPVRADRCVDFQWMKNPQHCARHGGTNRAMSDEDAGALTAFLISQKGAGKSELAKAKTKK